MIEAALNEQKLWLIIVDMGRSEEEGERSLKYFQGQKLPWLRTFLQERSIQTSSGSGCFFENKLTVHAHVAFSISAEIGTSILRRRLSEPGPTYQPCNHTLR